MLSQGASGSNARLLSRLCMVVFCGSEQRHARVPRAQMARQAQPLGLRTASQICSSGETSGQDERRSKPTEPYQHDFTPP